MRSKNRQSLDGIGLNTRVHNALMRAGIKDVESLLSLPASWLESVSGLGSKSRREVRTVIADLQADSSTVTHNQILALRAIIDRIAVEPWLRAAILSVTEGFDLDRLDLPRGVVNSLRAAGVDSIGELLSAEDLLDVRGIGSQKLTLVEKRLQEFLIVLVRDGVRTDLRMYVQDWLQPDAGTAEVVGTRWGRLGLERLSLSVEVCRLLKARSVTCLSQLLQTLVVDLREWCDDVPDAEAEIRKQLKKLADRALSSDEEPDLRPALVDFECDGVGLVTALFPQIQSRLCEIHGRRPVVMATTGMLSGASRTLEDIGRDLGVTRERVRQLRKPILDDLYRVLRGEILEYHVPAVLLDRLAKLRRLVRIPSKLISEHRVSHVLESLYGTQSTADAARLAVFLRAHGYRRHSSFLSKGRKVWVSIDLPGAELESLQKLVRFLATFLCEQLDPQTLDNLRDAARDGGMETHHDTLRWLLHDIVPGVENVDGQYRVRLQDLETTAQRVARVLHEEGEPLHFREISDRIAAAYRNTGATRVPSVNAIRNQLTGRDQFAPTGRQGRWSLREWGLSPTLSVTEILCNSLVELATATSVTELHRRVVEQWSHTTVDTVRTILSTNDKFVRTGTDHWELSEWGNTPAENTRKSPEHVTSLLRAAILEFNSLQGGTNFKLATLLRYIRASTSLSDGTIRNRLAHARWAQQYRGPDATLWVEIDIELLMDESSPKKSVAGQVADLVREYLRSTPKQEATLSDIWGHVAANTTVRRQTFYWAVGKMDDLEKQRTGNAVYCRLVRR